MNTKIAICITAGFLLASSTLAFADDPSAAPIKYDARTHTYTNVGTGGKSGTAVNAPTTYTPPRSSSNATSSSASNRDPDFVEYTLTPAAAPAAPPYSAPPPVQYAPPPPAANYAPPSGYPYDNFPLTGDLYGGYYGGYGGYYGGYGGYYGGYGGYYGGYGLGYGYRYGSYGYPCGYYGGRYGVYPYGYRAGFYTNAAFNAFTPITPPFSPITPRAGRGGRR